MEQYFIPVATVVTLLLLAGCIVLLIRYRGLRQRYGGIADVDAAVVKSQRELATLAAEHEQKLSEQKRALDTLSDEYRKAKSTYDALRHEISLVEENLEDISFGLYNPHYDFQTSDDYKAALDKIREQQKAMVRADAAARFEKEWTVSGSRAEGARMQKQYTKLMLRAFNGECEAAVANVTWNNVTRMEERVRKSFEALNKLGGVMTVSITPAYRDLKLEELRLKHELEEKCRAEKEEQRRIREQMREEEQARREIERAREDAEEEESRYEKALVEARAKVAAAQGAALETLGSRIKELEEHLRVAHEQKERAVSRAQLTRSGHVYIISNLGSFGERVVKIGMTRRLEPLERIKELSDASVPFDFDVHAILYSEDAPALEANLQAAFWDKRINLVNPRKEFFATSVDEVETVMRSKGLSAVLTKLAEARDYRETLSLRNAATPISTANTTAFPDELLVGSSRGGPAPSSSATDARKPMTSTALTLRDLGEHAR